jgi:periplasmic protein TonB
MSRELFQPLVDGRKPGPRGRLSALPISIAVHAGVLAAVVVIPVLANSALPLIAAGGEPAWTPVVLPSPPQAPTPSQARPQAVLPPDTNVAPVVAPHGVSDERSLFRPPDEPFAIGQQAVVDGGIEHGIASTLVDAPPPPPAPRAPMRVSGLKAPVRIHDVAPVYPEAARLARIEGTVIIEAVIGTTGDVVEARILRSRPLLDEAAVAAVRQWKYTPTLLGGVPVPVVMTVTVTFTLR